MKAGKKQPECQNLVGLGFVPFACQYNNQKKGDYNAG
jgi:hypothetical protein